MCNRNCRVACDNVNKKLSELTARSSIDQTDRLDKIKLHFKNGEIQLLKSRLGGCKQTLSIAIGVVALEAHSHSREGFQELEINFATSVNEITGQIHGLEISIQSLGGASHADIADIVAMLNDQSHMLKQCLEAYTAALAEVIENTGATVKHALTFNESRQFVGNIGLLEEAAQLPTLIMGKLETNQDKS
ncbi:hypothetical protein F4677DRAFT_410421 [Hypoxylon crocopeplum]|nr:hypothetical protein F4677DRAFT_410421 [Hypoxylon crocopeplum]